MFQIRISDQLNAQPIGPVHIFQWRDNVPCTLRLLLEERITIEYARARGADGDGFANHLIHLPPRKQCSLDKAIEAGFEGFRKQAFFVIVNGRQVTALDEAFSLTPETEITFVKLLPLQGG